MSIYAGLDVSDKTTHICVVGADGAVLKRDVVASDPDLLAKWFRKHCPVWRVWCWKLGLFPPFSTMVSQNGMFRSNASARGMPRECWQRGWDFSVRLTI